MVSSTQDDEHIDRVYTLDDSFVLFENETLLEGLERQGYTVEYQCRSGYCGSCRCKLLEGKVSYAEQPLAFIGPNEILPCCCRPQEGDIVLALERPPKKQITPP